MPTEQRLPSPGRPEHAVAQAALDRVRPRLDWEQVQALARPWVDAVRREPGSFWAMESLLHTFPLHSNEGLALMRLAEALLRVPDDATASALLHDLLTHLSASEAPTPAMHTPLAPWLRRALGWVQHTLPDTATEDNWPSLWQRLGAQGVLGLARQAVQLLGQQFVLAQTLPQALHAAQLQRAHTSELRFSFDMLGEGARTASAADHYLVQYTTALQTLAARALPGGTPLQQDGLFIKLSALHPH